MYMYACYLKIDFFREKWTELFYKTVYFIAPKYWQAVSNRRNWQEPTSFPCVVWMKLPEVTSGKCVTGVCRVAVDSAEKCRYTCPTMHQMPLSNGRHKCIVEDTINWDSNLLSHTRSAAELSVKLRGGEAGKIYMSPWLKRKHGPLEKKSAGITKSDYNERLQN